MNDAIWTDLVVAMLSVNSYSVEKSYAIANQLAAEGLTDPMKLATFEPDEIARRLDRAGYKRGTLNTYRFHPNPFHVACAWTALSTDNDPLNTSKNRPVKFHRSE